MTQSLFKNGIHAYIPNIVADRRKLLEIRNEAFQTMGARFQNTTNDSDSIIDRCIYEKNGFLLYGSSKRESYRTPYKLTHCWKVLWSRTGPRLEFRMRSYNPADVSMRNILHGTLLRVKSDDYRRAPCIIPILIEAKTNLNTKNWDAK